MSKSLTQFYSNRYINATVLPSDLFYLQMKSSFEQFMSLTTNELLLSLEIIRKTKHADAFSLDAYAEPSVIYDKSGITKLFKIPGIYKGCFMIESLLQSTLECFYNQTCINQLNSYLLSNSSLDVKALDSSLTSRFVEKSTMEELINKLLIEQWNLSMIHENYYNACQPISCIYSYTTRNDIIYILTIVIGLVGGIIEILKFVIPPVIQSFAQYWFKTK
ncbi:unnamed protein product [Rotaria magnacalcarata]|uniref:Uncharacterized protein n=1 Tax=Rotaria magnacalcarata TaxID=392030 RepID=A0A8S2WXV0_9BILA|nr:unnamed protein product [Rotaria magnacalcarata]CAF4525010.1 unnamed protein product [Rotaria magnacalcarata]CAF5174598.1 unnamed protein product [Rotaria magnacalcarata]